MSSKSKRERKITMSQKKTSQEKKGKKTFGSVSQLTRDLAESQTFADAVVRRLAERDVLDHLMALRTTQGLSQKDIAGKIGCTQSRISKLEGGKDNDLRLGDFAHYADALGYNT